MASLFDELQAREAAARARVEELEAEIAELTGRLEAERERLFRLMITRETVSELAAEGCVGEVRQAGESARPDGEAVLSPFAGVETRVVGALTVPRWQPGLTADVLPEAYRDIVEVIADAPGPVRAKQIVPRIGLPAETAKIEGTRSKLKRLVERGLAGRGCAGVVHPGARAITSCGQRRVAVGLFSLHSKVPTKTNAEREEP